MQPSIDTFTDFQHLYSRVSQWLPADHGLDTPLDLLMKLGEKCPDMRCRLEEHDDRFSLDIVHANNRIDVHWRRGEIFVVALNGRECVGYRTAEEAAAGILLCLRPEPAA